MNFTDPVFHLITFPDSPDARVLLGNLPEARHALFESGVPSGFIGQRYEADGSLTIMEVPPIGPVVRFGSSGLADAMCVDPRTGHILEIIMVTPPSPLFVNSSLGLFTRTVQSVLARFPYYSEHASDKEIDKVAAELSRIIEEIDPEAAIPDRYWSTFVDDVAIGDLTTEDIRSIGER